MRKLVMGVFDVDYFSKDSLLDDIHGKIFTDEELKDVCENSVQTISGKIVTSNGVELARSCANQFYKIYTLDFFCDDLNGGELLVDGSWIVYFYLNKGDKQDGKIIVSDFQV